MMSARAYRVKFHRKQLNINELVKDGYADYTDEADERGFNY
ncbi:hypothetical protein [Bacteroides ndongoniae]|nr:hypothetical protein [Bacteroides ndongoniae]